MLNADGGTLLIGAKDDGTPRLADDISLIKRADLDGLVNWLTDHPINSLAHRGVMRTKVRVDTVAGVVEICRADDARFLGAGPGANERRSRGLWIRDRWSELASARFEPVDHIRVLSPRGRRSS